MPGLIRLIVKVMILCVLYPFRIFPIKNNRILLLNNILNFDAKYSCNCKYIAEYLLKYYENKFEIVYPIGANFDEIRRELVDKKIIFVKLRSLKYYYYCMTSKFFITTSGSISYMPFRKEQIIINTWHGGGAYKKFGLDVNSSFFYRLDCRLTSRKTNYFVSTNKYFSKIIQRNLLIQKEKILEIGMPRNDIFFANYNNLKKRIKQKLGVLENDKIVLYAPTYRSKAKELSMVHTLGNCNIDIDQTLKSLGERFGGNWIFALRVHPSLSKNINEISNKIINLSEYEDVQELLCIADVLINDYSSIMWDFAQTRKPCFIFAEDLEEYENSTGLYTKPSEWPFLLAESNEKLVENILKFNEEKYKEKLEAYFKWMGNFEEGCACKKICDKIYSIYKNI